VRSLTLGLLLLGALGGCALPAARDAALETSLREEIHTVRVADADATIVVTSFRPSGDGPFPGTTLWTAAVASFFRSQGVALPFELGAYAVVTCTGARASSAAAALATAVPSKNLGFCVPHR